MKTISKAGDNLGGLTKIWAVPKTVFSISGRAVSFSATADIYEIYCTPESMEFKELSEKTAAGIHYNTSVSGFVPKDCSTALEAFVDMEGKPYVIIFKNGNGDFVLAGTSATPLRIDVSRNSGRQTADKSGYDFSFIGKTKPRAVFIDNPF